MKIGFKIYRSKNDEVIDEGCIRVNIGDALMNLKLEENEFILRFIEILQNSLTTYIENTEEVKKYGIGYVGRLDITGVVIENNDNMCITREKFLKEVHNKQPNLVVVYDK